MTTIHLHSEALPAWGSGFAPALAALISRAAAMGMLSDAPVTRLDVAAVDRTVRALQAHGIASDAGVMLDALRRSDGDAQTTARVQAGIERLHEALEASAAPQAEWPAMREVFGDDALVPLLGIAASSMRRYAAGDRATPDDVASRLHWLALVVGDLAGSYNHHGIRRWFERPRSQLDGRSPRELLGPAWDPDGPAATRVRALASALHGAAAFAA